MSNLTTFLTGIIFLICGCNLVPSDKTFFKTIGISYVIIGIALIVGSYFK